MQGPEKTERMNEAWEEATKMLGERECEKEEKDPTRRFPKDKSAGEREKRKLIWREATGIVPHVRHGKGHLSLQPFITHMQCRELGTCLAGEGAAEVPVPVRRAGDVGDAPYWILWGFLQWRFKALTGGCTGCTGTGTRTKQPQHATVSLASTEVRYPTRKLS